MSSTVTLTIVDTRDGTVFGTPTFARAGYETWSVTPAEMRALQAAFYADAPGENEIGDWAERYASPAYGWFLERDF